MDQLHVSRQSNEEPDFGDPDFTLPEDGVAVFEDGKWGVMQDIAFDKLYPTEAERIKEEVGKNQLDETNRNYTIRKDIAR